MSMKRFRYFFLLGLMIVVAFGQDMLVQPAKAAPVKQQSIVDPIEPACISCHDNLYYNYDLGKLYCVSEARTRCVDCHGGDPFALDKAAAHKNMVAYPTRNGDISNCQSCHPQDYAAHLDKFGTIAGFRPLNNMSKSSYNSTSSLISTSFPVVSDPDDLAWHPKLLISLAAFLVFGLLISKFLRH